MKRQDIIDWMRRYSNYKMQAELRIIENNEKGAPVHFTAQGLHHYFQCGYAIGILREKLHELDRKRNAHLKSKQQSKIEYVIDALKKEF